MTDNINEQNINTENSSAEKEEKLVEIIGVTFKSAGKIYYFDANGVKANERQHVIVDTSRGYEYGKVTLSNRMVPEAELVLPLRKVMRVADRSDDERYSFNCEKEKEAYAICVKKIASHGLAMKLIDVEYTFDNAKLLFYFTSEERVDFRELVKDLASVFKTRIELRQIGLRDEAKIMGGFGICGREFCCHSFLGDFVQVSIKMAKEQNLSLNAAKISGACGRLMCCLRYEHETYQEELKKLPKADTKILTPDGVGTVTEVQPLSGLVKVRLDSDSEGNPVVYDKYLLSSLDGKPIVPEEERRTAERERLKDKSAKEDSPDGVLAEYQKLERRRTDNRRQTSEAARNDNKAPEKKEAKAPEKKENKTPEKKDAVRAAAPARSDAVRSATEELEQSSEPRERVQKFQNRKKQNYQKKSGQNKKGAQKKNESEQPAAQSAPQKPQKQSPPQKENSPAAAAGAPEEKSAQNHKKNGRYNKYFGKHGKNNKGNGGAQTKNDGQKNGQEKAENKNN